MSKHKERFEQAMAATDSTNDLANLVNGAGAVGDLKLMWREIAAVAPAEIQSDAEATASAWDTAEQEGIDRDGAGALANALLNTGSLTRLSTYIAEHCGEDLAPGPVPQSPTTTVHQSATLLDQTFSDKAGYQYRVVLKGPAVYTPVVDIANAKPGAAIFSFTLATTGTIYNLTPNRNAPLPEGAVVAAAWPSSSQACQVLSANASNADVTSGYCGRQFEINAPSTTIASGGSLNFTSMVGLILPLELDESMLPSVQSSFQTPSGWAFMTGGAGIASVPNVCVSDQPVCAK
ncbi:hypothetical protein [Nocardia higoensis]|uniref:hypothetical protein n=1 Tax=Nocardia higoensis TaxID=228599 RepID=UPI0012F65646|nr:hypothetical protein [Nocardia higoensis]